MTPRHFARLAWHLATSAFVSRGRRGTWRHPLSFCVAGVALRALPSFCVAGVALGDIRIPPPPPPHRLSHTTLSHTIFHHTIFSTQLCHTPSFATPCFTHRFVTHHLSHTQLCHTLSFTHTHIIFHTQLCHTYHFSLSHTIFHTQLCHTHTHTVFLCHTLSFTYHFVTHNSSHTLFYFSIIHHILCLSFLSRPPYNICRSLLEEVDLWVIRSFNSDSCCFPIEIL